VTIKGNNIDDAGIDGVSVTGNTIKNLTIQQNTIDGSRQNGIGFRNSANFGSSSANIVNNKILNSGGAGSGYGAINIGATTTGAPVINDNGLLAQSGSTKLFINSRASATRINVECNWWGSAGEDDITSYMDAGVSGAKADYVNWRVTNVNNATGTTGFTPPGNNWTGEPCAVTPTTVAVSCNGGADGQLKIASITGGSGTITYSLTSASTSYSSTAQTFAASETLPYTLKSNLPAANDYVLALTNGNGDTETYTGITVTQPSL
ncbi:MAG: hypothetical protein ACK45E_07695, partial [Ignavibacteria bacterium]